VNDQWSITLMFFFPHFKLIFFNFPATARSGLSYRRPHVCLQQIWICRCRQSCRWDMVTSPTAYRPSGV